MAKPSPIDGLTAAIALLTATVPRSELAHPGQDETLSALLPDTCAELIDLFAGLYEVAHALLLELSAVSGGYVTEPLQRLALEAFARRDR